MEHRGHEGARVHNPQHGIAWRQVPHDKARQLRLAFATARGACCPQMHPAAPEAAHPNRTFRTHWPPVR